MSQLWSDVKVIEKEIYERVSRAYNWLFNLAIHSGNWNEVRSTALVGLCLKLREPMNSPWIENIKKWLIEQQKPIGSDMASWGEELWDTSMALICLKHLGFPQKDPHYQKAIHWMISLYNKNNRHNWHDEPWETSWSIWAILETEPSPELSEIAYNAIKWLLSLQDTDGKIISPHYTAYFILLASKLLGYYLKLSQEEKDMISTAIAKAVKYLINNIQKDILWTGEPWSNGVILWILCSTGNFPYNNKDILQEVVNWFFKHQENDGNWLDVEDTALSILGLIHLLKGLESVSDLEIHNNLNNLLKTPTLCLKRKFIQHHDDGYTSINLSPRFKKVAVIIASLVSVVAAIITLRDFIIRLLFGR